jgi:exodeoxyribonuclease V alpha subunit
MTITTTLTKLIYEKDGFFIAKDDKEKIFKCTLAGFSPNDLMHTKIRCEVDEVESKYGKQYEIKSYEILENPISFYLKRVAKTGLPKETIRQLANDFSSLNDFIHKANTNPDDFLKYKHLGKVRLKKLIKSIEENRDTIQLANLLGKVNITGNFFNAIYEYMKKNRLTTENLKENPYIITKIDGIGFKKADALALKLGINEYSKLRIEKAVEYLIDKKILNKGDTIFDNEEVFNELAELLNLEKEKLQPVYSDVIQTSETIERIHRDLYSFFITKKSIYDREKYIIDLIDNYDNLRNFKLNIDDKKIENYLKSYSIEFSEKQKNAIMQFTKTDAPFFILGGYAGTGKTTTSKAIMDIYADYVGKDNVIACALSGNASNRIKSVSGYNAYTIHSLLGYNGYAFTYNEFNPLPYRLIVLDEASMVDVYLFYALLKAIDFTKSKLFIIGDDAQLSPVGPGEVFANMLKIDKIEKVVLDKVFRQKETQVINIFAQDIRKGIIPKNYLDKYEDFAFKKIEKENYYAIIRNATDKEKKVIRDEINNSIKNAINILTKKANNKVLKEIKSKIINEYGNKEKFRENVKQYLYYYQIITPQKDGIVGTNLLNIHTKQIINPSKETIGIFDKVIHLKNKNRVVMDFETFNKIKPVIYKLIKDNRLPVLDLAVKRLLNLLSEEEYEDNCLLKNITDILSQYELKTMRVFNGQIGMVINRFNINEKNYYFVYYPNEDYVMLYDDNDFQYGIIDLGYAFTIHKSQGSEYSVVAMPMSMSNAFMLNNRLLYTGITRAKKKIFIFGETYAFNLAVKKQDEVIKNTLIRYKIEKENENEKISVL